MTPAEQRAGELARIHNATEYGSKIDFKAGFRAFKDQPEVLALVEALECLSQPLTNTSITVGQLDNYVTEKASEALSQWKSFVGEV